MFHNILEKINEYDTIIIHRHIRPDGDCIGSQMGLKALLKANFPNKNIYAVGDEIPDYLKGYGENDDVEDEWYQGALAIVVDTAAAERICDTRYQTAQFIIKIDHHDNSYPYADMEYVDSKSPACAAILVRFYLAVSEDLIMPLECAKAWYLAITTDTGRFRYRGVNGEVLANAGFLVDQGVDIENLYTKLYIKDVNPLKLQGYVYQNFKISPNGVAYIHFTKSIMERFKVTKEEAGNLVNSLDSIRGSLIWAVFIDQMKEKDPEFKNKKEAPEKEMRVRIRSRFVAINEIASQYRGGGHLMASGATVYGKQEMNQLLTALDQTLAQYKLEHPEKF